MNTNTAMAETAPQTYTVSQLTALIKEILEGAFPPVWVSGELSNFSHPDSGHMYFTLKDETAELRCAMFRGMNRFLRFTPKDGMQVLVQGNVRVYERRGSYQLAVQRMEPAGLGTLYLAFEALKRKLSDEGLFDPELKQELPRFPRRIGIITSRTGAAVKDILHILKRRAPYVTIILRPSRVQGDLAAKEISEGIRELNDFNSVDVIILGRGGGSLEDLWPFNEERVARAIFDSKIPVISAVGHETDVAISDMVADLRAPTSSAAAELVAPDIEDLKSRISAGYEELQRSMVSFLEAFWQRLDANAARYALTDPRRQIDQQRQFLISFNHQMAQAVQNRLDLNRSIFRGLSKELEALNPKGILNRGYAIAYGLPQGNILRNPDDLGEGDPFELQLAEGRMGARKESRQGNG